MPYHWMKDPKVLIFTPLMLLLLFAVACGGTAAEPIIVEKEVVKEVIKEVVVEKEVIKEVPVEVVVEKEVIKEVFREVMVIATPVVSAKSADVPDYVAEGASKHYNGVFPVMASRNPGFWDVHYGGSLNTTLTPSGVKFNQLLEYDPLNPTQIIGDLAESWDINKGGREFIFRLHDAKWHDGTPVTADDIVFSLDRITQPGALRARTGFLKRWYEHGTATAVDAKTVKVPLKSVSATFVPNLASDYMKMYPRALENVSQDDFNCCPEKTWGSGPWVFKNWKKDDSYEFERFVDYFKAPRPFFDGLKVFQIKSKSRRIAALQAGQVFSTYQPWDGTPPDWAQLEKDTKGRIRLATLEGAVVDFIWLNVDEPPFDNPKVRRALYLAVDRIQGVKVALEGHGLPGTFFSPGYVEDPSDFTRPGLRANKQEDYDEAKKLLAEAGFPDGFKTEFNVVSQGVSMRLAEAITPQIRDAVGIDLVINGRDLASFYVELRDGTYPANTVGTGIILTDPGDILNQFFDKDVLRNPQNWSDPRLDKLMAAQDTELDPAKRKAMFKEFAEILNEGESHIIPVWWRSSGAAIDYRIRNYFSPPTVQLVHKWDHIWFDPDRKMPSEPGYHP